MFKRKRQKCDASDTKRLTKMSSSCLASSSKLSPFSSLKKNRESAASRNSLRVRSLDPSPSVVGLPNNDSMMISTESSPTSLKMMKEEEEKEEDKVVVVVFTNFNQNSYLKYPKSLPDYSEYKKPSGEVSWKEVCEHMRLR